MGFFRKKPRRIALFGGSFDPPHIGHSEICRWCFKHNHFDELWIIPCYHHPLGKQLISFDDRLAMCRLAFGKLNLPLQVLDVERRLGGKSHTLRTILQLMADHPEDIFTLITGGDIDREKRKWHEFEKIHDLVQIVSIPRGEHSPIPDVSSTRVRWLISENESFTDLVEKEVAIYIITKTLYRS